MVSASGRQLVLLVVDKSFKDEPYTPEYLWDGYTLPVNSNATGAGSVAKRWDPYVVDRMSRLFAELGRAFDSHVRFRHEHSDPDALTRYWTPREILEFARDDLGVHYLFWNRVLYPKPPDSYTIEDAYPVIAALPSLPGDTGFQPKAHGLN